MSKETKIIVGGLLFLFIFGIVFISTTTNTKADRAPCKWKTCVYYFQDAENCNPNFPLVECRCKCCVRYPYTGTCPEPGPDGYPDNCNCDCHCIQENAD